MIRLTILAAALTLAASAVAAAPLTLERVVVVQRHGVRPPTSSNADLAKYSDKAWPDWPVPPGDLTPHGGETVKLVGATLREAYRRDHLLPASGCAGAGSVTVWADGIDQRTRQSGAILAEALQPGCGLTAPFSSATPRDPIFGGSDDAACKTDPDKLHQATAAVVAGYADAPSLRPQLLKLQAIFAPKACDGGPGTCFTPATAAPGAAGVFPSSSSLAEDLLLEYGDGKPLAQVGWGRASAADISEVMAMHERGFALIRDNLYSASHHGAQMAHVVLDALAGQPAPGGPQSGPNLKLLGLAGHDTNLVLMASIFGLKWTLPGEPDATAPSTALAFELWSDGTTEYVRPVIYYLTLDQLRTLSPGQAKSVPLTFDGCDSGPMGSCPLETVKARVEAILPPGCGDA